MAKLTNIELVHQYLHNVKKPASLNEIWDAISSQIVSQKKDKISVMADLYGDLVLDNRFALTSDNLWALSGSPKVEDVKKQYAAFIDENERRTKGTTEAEDFSDETQTLIADEDFEEEDFEELFDDFEEDEEEFSEIKEFDE